MLNEKKNHARVCVAIFLILALIFCGTASATAGEGITGYGWALDLLIGGVLVIYVLYGVYKGFLATTLHFVGSILSWVLALSFYPSLSSLLAGNTDINQLIMSFTQGSSNIGDIEILNQNVSSLDVTTIKEVIAGAQLPEPIASLLENNILNQVFSGTDLTSLSQYFDQTFCNIVLNVLSFLIIFLAVKLVVAIVIKLTDLITRLPGLKQFDRIFGGVIGLGRGAFCCYVVFALVPLLLTVVPNDMLRATVEGSFLAKIFYEGNIITAVINGLVS